MKSIIRQFAHKIEELETEIAQPENEKLALWHRLVDWQQWRLSLDDPDNWQDDFSALPRESDVRQLYNNLMWFENSFEKLFLDIDVSWRQEKMKEVFFAYIKAGLIDEKIPSSELKRSSYLNECIELCQDLLVSHNWEWLEQELEEFHRPPPTIQRKDKKPMEEDKQQMIEVPSGVKLNGGNITIEYVGRHINMKLVCVDGVQDVKPGEHYTVSPEVLTELEKQSFNHLWKRVKE